MSKESLENAKKKQLDRLINLKEEIIINGVTHKEMSIDPKNISNLKIF